MFVSVPINVCDESTLNLLSTDLVDLRSHNTIFTANRRVSKSDDYDDRDDNDDDD